MAVQLNRETQTITRPLIDKITKYFPDTKRLMELMDFSYVQEGINQ